MVPVFRVALVKDRSHKVGCDFAISSFEIRNSIEDPTADLVEQHTHVTSLLLRKLTVTVVLTRCDNTHISTGQTLLKLATRTVADFAIQYLTAPQSNRQEFLAQINTGFGYLWTQRLAICLSCLATCSGSHLQSVILAHVQHNKQTSSSNR